MRIHLGMDKIKQARLSLQLLLEKCKNPEKIYLNCQGSHDIPERMVFLLLHNLDKIFLPMPLLHQVKDWLAAGCVALNTNYQK